MRYLFIALLLILIPGAAHAAELSITPPLGPVRAGDTFTVNVLLNTGVDSANAVEGRISASANLKILRADTHASVVSLWAEAPAVSGNTVHFAGVIPGGYKGTLSPDWVGYRPGAVLTLILTARNEGAASVSLSEATVLANDGQGTPLSVKAYGVDFSVLPGNGVTSVPPVVVDTVPPEAFAPLVTDGTPFGIKGYALVFSAVDKRSDIISYSVAHSEGSLSDADASRLSWQDAESPYAIPASLYGEYLYVKAVDAYGNERIERVSPVGIAPGNAFQWIMLIGGALLILLFVLRRKGPAHP